MIVLDTNVVSELMRPAPDPSVIEWVAARPRRTLFTTTITQAEILYGIELLADGRRRDALAGAATAIFAEEFAGRVLPFDQAATGHFARIAAERRRAGRPITSFDALIAAITRAAGAGLATRNLADFEGLGLALVNPWDGG
ncbi:type II toxin-antitoxin system VapC family toxin [Amorphus sp. 3PC139-8]|uniref:type II toxin-antitoxin system VapC family toxin n=1 Tax=Amorphus sp. 3PC139-8 TaxID=2735676 RepID=UPI00345D8249